MFGNSRATWGALAAPSALTLLLTAGCSGATTSTTTSSSPTTSAASVSPSADTSSASPSTSAPADTAAAAGEKVTLKFWTWVPKINEIVQVWNAKNPDIQVKVDTTAQGDALITKLLTADKAGNAPDLFQAEYQALPSLVTADVAADITSNVASIKDKFSAGSWGATTFNNAVYGVPQDIGPMALFYREDLFKQMGLKVPTTWDEYAQEAAAVHAKDPKKFLGTFSSTDPGWFAGLSQQAGAKWWQSTNDNWTVSVNDAATKKVATYWGDLVNKGDIQDVPFFTPQFNKELNDGTLLTWPVATWGSGVISGNAPDTKGKWRMAPMPVWNAGDKGAGYWGGSSTAVWSKSTHKEAAAKFSAWLNSDPEAVALLIGKGGLYPASSDGQSSPELSKAPEFFPNQPDFFSLATQISADAKGFTFGPDVNVTYNAYRDAFGKVVKNKAPYAGALDDMQKATVDDMKKTGFAVTG